MICPFHEIAWNTYPTNGLVVQHIFLLTKIGQWIPVAQSVGWKMKRSRFELIVTSPMGPSYLGTYIVTPRGTLLKEEYQVLPQPVRVTSLALELGALMRPRLLRSGEGLRCGREHFQGCTALARSCACGRAVRSRRVDSQQDPSEANWV